MCNNRVDSQLTVNLDAVVLYRPQGIESSAKAKND